MSWGERLTWLSTLAGINSHQKEAESRRHCALEETERPSALGVWASVSASRGRKGRAAEGCGLMATLRLSESGI